MQAIALTQDLMQMIWMALPCVRRDSTELHSLLVSQTAFVPLISYLVSDVCTYSLFSSKNSNNIEPNVSTAKKKRQRF